jgi:hypothetical protein
VVLRKVYVELRSKVSLILFDPRGAEGMRASYELWLGEDRFSAEVADGRFEVFGGATDRPDATIETDPDTLVYEGRPFAEALRTHARPRTVPDRRE